MSKDKPRQVEISVDIDAPANAVWKGISEGEEIQKWFCPVAKVEPREGGTMFLSWGPGCEGTGRIEVWKPDEHLCVSMPPSDATLQKIKASGFEGPTQMAVDYIIEGKGGKSRLRLVHSGFQNAAAWDDEYNGTTVGWKVFLRNLRHIVTHPGKPVQGLMHYVMTGLPHEDAWERALNGIVSKGSFAGKKEGDAYEVTNAAGERMTGRIDWMEPRKGLLFTVDQLQDALVGFSQLDARGTAMINWGALCLDMTAAEAEAVKQRWAGMLDSIFAGANPAGVAADGCMAAVTETAKP